MGVSYAEAVRLLGGTDNRLVTALDRLTGGVLLAATAGGSAFALSLFDAKGELARLGAELVGSLRERMSGLGRLARTDRLAAAHSVLVLTAYFDAVAAAGVPVAPGLSRTDQVMLVSGERIRRDCIAELAVALLRSRVPAPAPQFPYEVTLESLRGFYGDLSLSVVAFVTGLAEWDRLDETARGRALETLGEVPRQAVVRYEELFRQLAGEFPEVAFWANLVDHRATREQLRTGLADLERISAEELTAAYETCLRWAMDGFAPFDTEALRRFRAVFLRQLAADWDRLPAEWCETTAGRMVKASQPGSRSHNDGRELLQMAIEVVPYPFPDSALSRLPE